MTVQPKALKRILLKLSGELLGGGGGNGIDPRAVATVAERIAEARDGGAEIGLVVGAGNLFRGLGHGGRSMDRCGADAIGMLATVMNALALRDALEARGIAAEVQSAIAMQGIAAEFDHRQARRALAAGTVVLFAAGTGHPFFTTDTTAALRACQIEADAVLKGTKVDGIYTADPVTNPDARRYARISFDEALAKDLRVMDATAFSLCRENDVPIIVFKFGAPGDLGRLIGGDFSAATLVCSEA